MGLHHAILDCGGIIACNHAWWITAACSLDNEVGKFVLVTLLSTPKLQVLFHFLKFLEVSWRFLVIIMNLQSSRDQYELTVLS